MGTSKLSGIPQQYEHHPFQLSLDQIVLQLQTHLESGLNRAQASNLQGRYGENKLAGEGAVRWYSVLLKQISNAMILVTSLERSTEIKQRLNISYRFSY